MIKETSLYADTDAISRELKEKYDNQYSDRTEAWRKLGAVGKVENILDVTKGYQFENVVDVGAGDGNILSLLSQHSFSKKYTAAEISNSALEQIRKKNIDGLADIQQFNGYHLPFEDNTFDLAVCSHVIEHVEFPRKLLREIRRISKNQVLEIPIDFSFGVDKKFKHFYEYGHINIYTPSLFNFLLLSEGFKILNKKNALYKKEVVDFQLKKNSKAYLATKVKRMIWKAVPKLMQIKPNTYTVLTQ